MAINKKPIIDGGTVTTSKPKAPTTTTTSAPAPALGTTIGSGRSTSDVQSSSPAVPKAPTSPTAGTFIRWDYVGQSQTTGTLRRAVTSDGKGGEKINYVPEKNPDYVSGSRGAGVQAGIVTGNTNANITSISSTDPSTNITVLKSLLSSLGYSKALVDSSTQYFMSLISEGLDYDNIVSLYTDSKDYTLKSGTKLVSPFYEQYGYLNEGLTQTKSAGDLFNFVEGTKNLVKSYNISSRFAEPDALKKYIANNVTVEKLDERIMASKLKTITADPQYVNTLRQLKYINTSEDLTDFFLDPKIGEAQLEINRKTASFATEAMRRSNEKTGISFNADSLTKNAATLIGEGRTEANIADIANQGYETIAQILKPAVGLSNVFEGPNAANAQTIQQELEAEQFQGTASERRKRLTELGTNIMQTKTGRKTGNYSNAGMI